MGVILYFGVRGGLWSGLPLCQIEIRIYDESRRNTISDALSDTPQKPLLDTMSR
jgi:hypothetical protein